MILSVLEDLISPVFLQLCLGLSVLLLIVGALVWLVERKANPKQFSPKVLPGLGDGFWFAGVTLSTIGYGDKAPVTVAGRLISMLWMLVGVVVTAGADRHHRDHRHRRPVRRRHASARAPSPRSRAARPRTISRPKGAR